MKRIITIILASTLWIGTAEANELREQALELFKPLPSTIPSVRDNPITAEKIELGKALFFDPRLSASGAFG